MSLVCWKPIAFILGILAAAVIAFTLLQPGAAQGQAVDPVPVFGHHEACVGCTIDLPLTFASLPDGISGFTIAVSVSDPSKLGISGIRVDAQDADGNIVAISDTGFTPALHSFTKSFVDLAKVWEAGANYPPFVTIQVEGFSKGNVNVTVEWPEADTDLGVAMNLATQATLVLVVDPPTP